MIVIARLCTPVALGQYALGLAISAPILSCLSLQLRAIQATDAKNVYEFADFFGLRALGTLIAILSIGSLALFAPWSGQTRVVVLILGLRAGIESFSDVVYGYFQKQERLDIIAKGMALRATMGVVVLTAALSMGGSIILALLLMSGTWLACLVLYEFPAAMTSFRRTRPVAGWNLRPAFLFRKTKPLIRVSLPLALVMFLLSSSQSVSRLYLQNYAGERLLGFFSAVATLSGGIGLVYMALGQAALPALSKMYSSDSSQFVRLLAKMLFFAAVSGLLLIALAHTFGPRALAFAYGSKFAGYGGLLTGLAFVAVLNNLSTLLGVGATASGHYWPQLAISALILATAAISGTYLIARAGLSGAMSSLILTALVQLAGYGFLCTRIAIKRPEQVRLA
jgi:O-antigen/teichoic acid export membrane protein